MSDEVSDVTIKSDATPSSWNETWSDADGQWWKNVHATTVIKSLVLFCVILGALIGNGLVVAAVVGYRRLRSVTNHFVVSLAVADLTVAVLVMPVSALFELRHSESHFSWQFCYFWISCDVTCCTASRVLYLHITSSSYVIVLNLSYFPRGFLSAYSWQQRPSCISCVVRINHTYTDI